MNIKLKNKMVPVFGKQNLLARFLIQNCWLVLIGAFLLVVLSIIATRGLSVSTKLEALMPEEAPSVITLQEAMQKAGSFASIQVVIEGEDKQGIEETLSILEAVIRRLPWSDSVQYFEDISVLERHKLLQLSVPDLEKVERSLEQELLTSVARDFEENTGISVTINLVDRGLTASSEDRNQPEAIEDHQQLLEPVETERRFVSDDGRTQALVIWPKPGHEGLSEAKTMIGDVANVIKALELNAPEDGMQVGIAGRIRNKVAQFDAVIGDVKIGLGSSVSLIILLLFMHYRRFVVVPLIIIPLVVGIIWTIGLTSVVIGGLNLITIFLALILFGLGIDFGIHNFSRYCEERANGVTHEEAITVVIEHTGNASLIAGLTTSAGFFALLFTEFRAFREFGFIAGSGIILIYIAMYSVFPALLSAVEKHVNWQSAKPRKTPRRVFLQNYLGKYPGMTAIFMTVIAVFAATKIDDLSFEKNFRNIQASQTEEHKWAISKSKSIFKGGHDRAVLVVDSLEEVEAIEKYFEAYAKRDLETPTIARVTSVRNFIPDETEQAERLKVINRMWERLEETGPLPDEIADKAKYLQIETIKTTDLPPAMRRVFLGDEEQPGYLMYIYNSVTMDDADLARQFYDDVAQFTVDGKLYSPASEGFIFVEMLALMKADAVRAVSFVSFVTILIVFLFVRSAAATLLVLLPTAVGLLFTLAIMAMINLPLSIINMVILPTLVGISVDNSIHIFERFRENTESIVKVMATTGRAAIVTTLTTLIGFGGLITASMGGLRSMGFLAIIGFSVCLFLTWTLLPVMLQLFGLSLRKQKI